MIKVMLQGLYSILISPFLHFFYNGSYAITRFLSSPLCSGPLNNSLFVDEIEKCIFQLEKKQLSPEEFILQISNIMREALHRGELDNWLQSHDEGVENKDVVLARKLFYRPLKWWYLKVHFMKEGNRHGLHAHRNVLSTQVIARGRLKVQEFDRLSPLTPPTVRLKLRNRGDAVVGDALMSTDLMANVHGFEPYSEGAVRFQFYLRGHTNLLNRFPKRGRLYVEIQESEFNKEIIEATLGRVGRPGES